MSGVFGLLAVIGFIYLVFFRKKKKKKKTEKKSNWVVPVAIVLIVIAFAGGGKTIIPKITHHAPSAAAPGNLSGNVAIGQRLASAYGWGSGSQWNCLYTLWTRESNWDSTAVNSSSGATGIPQLLPSAHSIPANWSDPSVQIAWGLNYVKDTYGNPCAVMAVYCNHPSGPSGCWY